MRIGYMRVSTTEQNTQRQDTNTPAGRFTLIVFAAIAELEREYIKASK